MSSEINKPTGYGYSSLMQRLCAECGHIEMGHYEKRCFRDVDFGRRCDCFGFTARELTEDERRILQAERQEKSGSPVKYVGEAWVDDLMREWGKRRIKGIDE